MRRPTKTAQSARSRGLGPAMVLAAGLLATGCAEEPSFTLRWRVAQDPDALEDAPRLLKSRQCSEVGIEKVRIEALISGGSLNNAVAARFEVPCFAPEFLDPDGVVAGPTLDPGTYRLELTGLDRKGDPWPCEEPGLGDDPEAQPVCPIARAEIEFTVAEDQTTSLDEESLVFAPPAQCQDGIDNDRDGLVDLADPACRRDLEATEDADTAASLFLISASFFDHNPNFKCSSAGVAQLRARVFDAADNELASELQACAPSVNFPVFSLSLAPASDYRVEVEAIGMADAVVTETAVTTFDVTAELGTFVEIDHDFGADEFIEPVVAQASFSVGFLSGTGFRRFCDPPASVGGQLTIEELEFRVTDENGDPVDPTQWAIPTPIDVTDGTARISCVNAPVQGPELTWGDYRIEVRALTGGETCYETDEPERLAPTVGQTSIQVDLPRVLDQDGMPSPACVDCVTDDDCEGSCALGICSDE